MFPVCSAHQACLGWGSALHQAYDFPADDCFFPDCHSDSRGRAYLVVADSAQFGPACLDWRDCFAQERVVPLRG